MKPETIYLSFDIEEFDMPFEYNRPLPLEEQIAVSTAGCHAILDLLKQHDVPATFFSTVVFARHAEAILERIREGGHELASHGVYHSDFKEAHLLESREALEALSGQPVRGFRMARMAEVSSAAIAAAGYQYNSSLNPVWLPGRYNHYTAPRTHFYSQSLLEIPASATPGIRIPLFWLAFHNLPGYLYRWLAKRTLREDGYLNIYFHPWEFTDLRQERYGLPWYVQRNTGEDMIQHFGSFIAWAKQQGYAFGRLADLAAQVSSSAGGRVVPPAQS